MSFGRCVAAALHQTRRLACLLAFNGKATVQLRGALLVGPEPSEICRSVLVRMLGTRLSEKPARKHQTVTSARSLEGTTNDMLGSLALTSSNAIFSNVGNSAPLTRPDLKKKN